MKKVLFTALIAISLVSCSNTKKLMDSYMGHTKAEVYQNWGPPNQVTSDGADGEILVYNGHVTIGQTPGTVYNNGYGSVSYTAPQQMGYNRTRMFYVNKNGVIYSWRAQGR